MIVSLKTTRFLTLVLLINALLIQTFPETLVLVDYGINTSEFAAVCINKDKPGMHCNGKCRMDEMMKRMHHNDKQNSKRQIEYHSSVYFPEKILSTQQVIVNLTPMHRTDYCSELHSKLLVDLDFKPPQTQA